MSNTASIREDNCKVGDFDPTPWDGPRCAQVDPELTFSCTRWPGHSGQHVAGTDLTVAAVWA
jgi:hypothetical protein